MPLPPGERKPKAIFNQYGATIGGPIRRNSLFYFLSYEGGRNRQNASRLETVATAEIRRGDMSASPNPVYDPAIGATYVVTPRLIVDANFGYTAYDANSIEPGIEKNIGLDVLGIPGTTGTRFFEGGWPRFAVTNYASMGAANNTTRPFFNRDPRYQYVANANWTCGTHSVRFGVDFSRQQINHTQAEFVGATHGPSGGFSFTHPGGARRLRHHL